MVDPLDQLAAIVRGDFHTALAASHPSLARNQVWCRACGATRSVDAAEALRSGWPKCCDATMTIDAPDERSAA